MHMLRFAQHDRRWMLRLSRIHSGTRRRHRLRLSKSAAEACLESGSAAPPCGKAPPFRPILCLLSASPQGGRLSLPACGEEVVEAACVPERPSLSASLAAEPRVTGRRIVGNLDKPGHGTAPTRSAMPQ